MFQRSELSWLTKQSDKNVCRHRLKIPTIGKHSKTELFREIQTFYTTNNDIRMNPNSTNPFINQLDQINDTFLLNLPPLSQSTPAPQALSQYMSAKEGNPRTNKERYDCLPYTFSSIFGLADRFIWTNSSDNQRIFLHLHCS